MNTKEKILQQSKDLFNTKGIQATTLRQVASALGISQGNLNYHFKTKQDIVERLYLDLVAKMDDAIEDITQTFSLLSTLYISTKQSMYIFYEYRFILRDMYLIFREYSTIRDHYLKLQEFRKGQFDILFDSMIEKKVLRPEDFAHEYERLYERLVIIGDNWINASEIFRTEEKQPIKYYLDLIFEMIYPYLTEKGKEEYSQLLH